MRLLRLCAVVLLLCAGRAQAACGWDRGELLAIAGEIEQGGLKGSFIRDVAPASGRFAEAIDLGVLKSGSGFDGHLAWSRDVSGASHYLNSDFAKRLAVSEAWITAHLSCPAPEGVPAGRFTPPGGAPIELRYDPRTRRLATATLQYPENRLIHHYSDWRAMGRGRFWPFVQRDEDPEDESESVYSVHRISRLRNASFRPSGVPDDSKIGGRGSSTIRFEDDDRRRIFLPVYLDGKGPFTFELDNGGHFILTQETAKALGLDPQGSFSSTGAGNEVRHSGYVMIRKLTVGSAEIVNQPAKVLPLSHNERGTLPPRAGILGLEFFERFIVGIDHRKKTVTLRPMSSPSPNCPGERLKLLFDEDAPLVSGAFEGIAGNIMLDIGNAGPTIIEDYWAARHGLRAKLAGGTSKGSAKLSRGRIRIGPFELRNETVSYLGPAERGSEITHSVAAIAGEPLLSRFDAVYDYRRGSVCLVPLPEIPPFSFQNRP